MSGGSPRVSVLMPVLNPHPIYFREAVESVLAQTFTDWELLIVEAPGDTSASPLLAPYNDPRIRHVVNPAKTSLVAQRNQLVNLASGQWLAMLDADDVAEPQRIAKQLELVDANPDLGIVGSQLTIIGSSGELLGSRCYPLSHREIAAAIRRFNPLAQSAVMVKRELVMAAGGYRYERYSVAEDYFLWSHLMQTGVRFANHPEPLIRYRIQAEQTKSQRLREHLLATLDIKRTYWRDELNLSDRLRLGIEQSLLFFPAGFVLWLFQRTQFRRQRLTTARSR